VFLSLAFVSEYLFFRFLLLLFEGKKETKSFCDLPDAFLLLKFLLCSIKFLSFFDCLFAICGDFIVRGIHQHACCRRQVPI
jgi:hypothetical protein